MSEAEIVEVVGAGRSAAGTDVDTERAPVPPVVFTYPLVVRLDNVEMFCDVFTVIVFVDRVRPVENVRGTSYADAAV